MYLLEGNFIPPISYKQKVGWLAPGDGWLQPVTESEECSLREPECQLCGLETERSPVGGKGASNHSQLFLLNNSVYKVKSTVPDILQMPNSIH